MTPEETKHEIQRTHDWMWIRAERREINASCIEPIIDSLCREAAASHGIPEHWRNFRPTAHTIGVKR